MKRFCHFLRANKSQELPHSFCCVDTETLPHDEGQGVTSHHLRFGWASYERTWTGRKWVAPEWFRFTRAIDFWTWLEAHTRPHTKTYVFAHNWSFDAPVVDTFNILLDRGWTLRQAIIESPPVILAWRRERTSMEMLDTLNWWRMPLAAIGQSLGIPKLPMPELHASDEDWDVYCRQDVEILRAALHHWWSFLLDHDLGGFARTLAGQAIRAYRHRFMETPILIDDDTNALALGRESYHGGRVEAFRLGHVQGPIHSLDVNSMYPFVMRNRTYPAVLKRRCRRVTLSELRRWVERYCVVARVDLDTKRNRFAHLVDDRMCFPVGCFTESLTTPDLVDALAHDEITSVDEVALYEPQSLFRSFVSELYALRLQATAAGNDVQRWLLKILLNALYGKFGQKGSVWESRGQAEDRRVRVWRDYDCVTGTTHLMRSFAGIRQEKTRDEEARESHPAIAAHVTAYARAYLWELFQRVKPGGVLYCDTDSLMVNDAGKERLIDEIDENRLGGLKHEWSAPWVEIHGAKDYRTATKTVCKGVKANAQWIDPDTVLQEQWSSFPGLVQAGSLDAPTTTLVEKHLARIYTKGTVDNAGTISPLTLSSVGG